MGRISILDDVLASKIAAGEVVERPASALKEFIENSIDSGAQRISIELDSGGKRLVRVSDDGCGMSRDDALLSIERHATSKIKTESELASINTLGFRGEALASIAGVSRFSLTTRLHDQNTGTAITVEGGRLTDVKDAGCPAGTAVEARSLFFNTRPRLKFLKTNETELSRSAAVARSAAIANPGVEFRVSHNGRPVFAFPRGSLEGRVRAVFGKTALYELGASREAVRVSGLLCAPSDGLSSMTRLYCYVNGRHLRDRFINRVLMERFGRVFEKGRCPQGAIFITLPADEVDVNVHPAKYEVRFASPSAVAAVIGDGAESFLASSAWLTGGEKVKRAVADFLSANDEKSPYGASLPSAKNGANSLRESSDNFEPSAETGELPLAETGEGFFSKLNVVGHAGGLYIVCEGREGLVIIDHHAAHERVNFERLKRSFAQSGRLKAQKLLMPEIIEMSPDDVILFGRFRQSLSAMGLDAEEFGENAVRLGSLPAILPCANGRDLFADVLSELGESGCSEIPSGLDKKTEHILATMACHKSIRAGYALGSAETQALLSEMDACELPHFCPHGRPVAVGITFSNLERMFKRK